MRKYFDCGKNASKYSKLWFSREFNATQPIDNIYDLVLGLDSWGDELCVKFYALWEFRTWLSKKPCNKTFQMVWDIGSRSNSIQKGNELVNTQYSSLINNFGNNFQIYYWYYNI